MRELLKLVGNRTLTIGLTDKNEGDMSHLNVTPVALAPKQYALSPTRWYLMRQCHSSAVLEVNSDTDYLFDTGNLPKVDGLIASVSNITIGALGADCPLIAMYVDDCAVGVIHAGWKGLERGVIQSAVTAMCKVAKERAGLPVAPAQISCIVGPFISAKCYEFGADDLKRLSNKFGSSIVAETAWATPALDLEEVIAVELDRSGVGDVEYLRECTGDANSKYFSHRINSDKERHCLYASITESTS